MPSESIAQGDTRPLTRSESLRRYPTVRPGDAQSIEPSTPQPPKIEANKPRMAKTRRGPTPETRTTNLALPPPPHSFATPSDTKARTPSPLRLTEERANHQQGNR